MTQPHFLSPLTLEYSLWSKLYHLCLYIRLHQDRFFQCSEAARPAADRTSDSQSGQIKSLILEAAQSLGR